MEMKNIYSNSQQNDMIRYNDENNLIQTNNIHCNNINNNQFFIYGSSSFLNAPQDSPIKPFNKLVKQNKEDEVKKVVVSKDDSSIGEIISINSVKQNINTIGMPVEKQIRKENLPLDMFALGPNNIELNNMQSFDNSISSNNISINSINSNQNNLVDIKVNQVKRANQVNQIPFKTVNNIPINYINNVNNINNIKANNYVWFQKMPAISNIPRNNVFDEVFNEFEQITNKPIPKRKNISNNSNVNDFNEVNNEIEIVSNRPLQNPLDKLNENDLRSKLNFEDDLTKNDDFLKKINPNVTIRDLEDLSINEKLMYDTRSFITYYWDSLKEEHLILNLLFYNSLYTPRYLRFFRNFTSISLMFCLNAMFYTDEAMEKTTEISTIQEVL